MLQPHRAEKQDKITGSFNPEMHASSSWLSAAISPPLTVFLASCCLSSQDAKAATELLQMTVSFAEAQESAVFYLNVLSC